jgi:hypothetical protein
MNQTRRVCLVLIVVAALFGGCASKPTVLPAGKDSHGTNLYVIAGEPDLNGPASRRADQYCERRGQSAVIQNSGYKESGFTFSCTAPE